MDYRTKLPAKKELFLETCCYRDDVDSLANDVQNWSFDSFTVCIRANIHTDPGEKHKRQYYLSELAAAHGSSKVLKWLVETTDHDLNLSIRHGSTLRYAVEFGHFQLVKYLVETAPKFRGDFLTDDALTRAACEAARDLSPDPMLRYLIETAQGGQKKINLETVAQSAVVDPPRCLKYLLETGQAFCRKVNPRRLDTGLLQHICEHATTGTAESLQYYLTDGYKQLGLTSPGLKGIDAVMKTYRWTRLPKQTSALVEFIHQHRDVLQSGCVTLDELIAVEDKSTRSFKSFQV